MAKRRNHIYDVQFTADEIAALTMAVAAWLGNKLQPPPRGEIEVAAVRAVTKLMLFAEDILKD